MNKLLFSGKLGRDIELRFDPERGVEGELSICDNEYIGKEEGTGKPKYWTTWVTAVIRGERARSLQDALYKGRFVVIEGRLRTRPYKISDTKSLPLTYVLVDDIDYDHRAMPPGQEAPPEIQK